MNAISTVRSNDGDDLWLLLLLLQLGHCYKVRFYSIRAAVVSLSAESVVFITQASVAAGLAVSSGRARCQ